MFFRKMTRYPNAERGGSLIETLMTVGFFGLFAAGFASMGTTQMKTLNSMELRSDIAVLKTTIASQIDCERTARSVCQGKNQIFTRSSKMRLPGAKQIGGKVAMQTILNNMDHADVASSPDLYAKESSRGEWQVAARCIKATRRTYNVHLYVARKEGEKFVKDPLTGRPWTWRDLYKGPICQGFASR